MQTHIAPNDFFLLISIGVLVMLLFAISLIVIFYTSQRKLTDEKMRQQMLQLKHQQELLFATIKTQEDERNRIANDLHDEIGSKLNVILMNLRFANKRLEEPTALQDTFREVEQLLNTTIDTTRRISHDLLPPILNDFGLVAALEELQFGLSNTAVAIHLDTAEVVQRHKNTFVELNLFRVIQELLKNSITHGEAKEIHIKMHMDETDFTIHYQDHGKGMEPSQLEERRGLGMQSIESRLTMCDAEISYVTGIGQGLQATITKTVMDRS